MDRIGMSYQRRSELYERRWHYGLEAGGGALGLEVGEEESIYRLHQCAAGDYYNAVCDQPPPPYSPPEPPLPEPPPPIPPPPMPPSESQELEYLLAGSAGTPRPSESLIENRPRRLPTSGPEETQGYLLLR